MLLHEIYEDLKAFNNQDGTDDYLGIDDFNTRIAQEQINLIVDVIDEEKGKMPIHRPMTYFMLKAETQAASADSYFWEVPEDLMRVESMLWIPSSGIKVPIEFVQSAEVIKRYNDILSPPQEENPIAYIEIGDTLHDKPYYDVGRWFIPIPKETSGGNYGLFYIGKPTTPFLDYYIDDSDELVFLDEDDDGDTGLSDITDSSYTYRTGETMDNVSGATATVELEIPVEFHQRFLDRMIQRLGLKDRDQLQYGVGKTDDVEDQTKNVVR